MKALVLGATGAVGRDVLAQLLADADYAQVDIFVRRAPDIRHDKLNVHVVDFERLADWQHLLKGDVLFSCLGTTIKDAGSQDAQWRVDYDYPLACARAAKANGVACYVLVSSDHADRNGQFFYPRMKGLLEEAVRELNFTHTMLFRPPVLERAGSDREWETRAVKAVKWLNQYSLLLGQKPLPTRDLADAMVRAAKRPAGLEIYRPIDIRRILAQ